MTPEEWEAELQRRVEQQVITSSFINHAAYKRNIGTAVPIPAHAFRLLLAVIRGLEHLRVDDAPIALSTQALLQACAMAEAGSYEEFQPNVGTLTATMWLVEHIEEIADAISHGYLVGVEVH